MKKLRIAIFKLIDILVILTMVSASPMNASAAVMAQDPGATLVLDKAVYDPGEIAHITGSGFTAGDYILAANDVVWGPIAADDTGSFTTDSPTLDTEGMYEVRAYAAGWSGDWEEAALAGASFTVNAPASATETPTEPTNEPTVAPTDTPTSEPTNTSTPEPPTIASDKADYQPGELVTLTGTGWTGDATVTITVVDSVPTVYHDTDQVQVRADGTIADSFYLPTSFVDVYFVTAKGAQTGRVATTMFTDAPGLTLTKSASPLTYTASGQTITYSYALQNTGTTTLNPPFNVTDNKVSTITCPNINTVGNGNSVLDPGETITCTGSYTITPSNVSFGFVANTASASSSGSGATTSNPDTRIVSLPVTCRNDTAGANDVPGQKDLTQECEAPSSANPLVISWNWDEISMSGGNSADGCALFDTDSDGLANYALCVSWQGQRVMQSGYPQLYSCSDTRSDRCTGSVPQTIQNGSGCALELASDDPFSAGTSFPQDTKAFCSINLADVGGAQISSMIDVCSYPSATPNSAPSDCVVITTSRGNLEVIKSVVPNDTSTNWNISWSGPTPYSTTITGSGDTGIQTVNAGSYSITETAGAGTNLSQYDTTWACTNNGSPTISGTGTTITGVSIANGNVVICAFTNTKRGHIIVDKVTSPGGDPASFSFDANGGTSPAYTDFSLTDAAAPNDQELKPGNYSVSETTPSGWTLSSATCTSSIGDTETPGAIELDAGETVTCTFNNTKQAPSLTLVKTATPTTYSAVGQTVNYSYLVTNSGNVGLAGPVTVTDDKATVTCPNVNTVGNLNGFLDPGESITCTASYAITQTDLNNGSVTNTATASAGGTDSNQDSETVNAVQSPALTLVKSATPGTYSSVGQVINYSYLVTNSGNVRLAGPVTATDDKATVTCPNVNTVGNLDSFLDPGESVTCSASYTIIQADLDNGSVTNTATASAGGTDSNQDSETVNAVQTPALTLVKSATPGTYDSVGDVISYSFLVTNSGNVRISGPVTITDDKATDEACPNVNTVGNLDSFLDPGESITCTASYSITQADLNDGSVTNIAQAHASGTDSNTDTETVDAVQLPALTLVKSATPSTYDSVGDLISYSFAVTNSGNVRIAGPVTITDDKATDEACPTVDTVGNLDSFLDPGESITCTASYSITQADLNAGSVTNVAQAHASGTDSNEDSETVNAIQTPALTLVKSAAPGTYDAAGDIISYSYLVTNSGNVRLAGPVTVTDDKATVTCPNVDTVGNLDSFLDPGESVTCSASYTITQADLDAGSVTNTAQAHADGTDSNTDTETVTATQTAALTLVKSAAPLTYTSAGDVISYSFLLTNSGNVTLVGPFTITDDKAADETCPVTPASLAPGDSVTCTATYTITQADVDAGSVTNTATGHGFFGATPVDSNQDSATVTATQSPALSLDKTASPSTYAAVGDTISYSYLLTNSGNVTLSGPFTVTDDKATVSCPVTSSLAPNASITCTASHTITQADLDAGSVTNTAMGHAFFDGDPVDSNQDSETVTATQSPALTLDKTASPATYASVSDVISYSYLLTNTGNVTLSGPFTVTDDKATVTCPSTSSLIPGASITCTATYSITQADLDAGSVTNTAQGHASFNGDPVDSNQDSETVTATQSPALSLAKSADPSTYDSVGDTISYSYVLTNTGNVTLAGPFTVTDDKATVTCPATSSLAPNASITCTASHTITQADLDAGSVTNTAQGHASFNGNPVDSNEDSETVTAAQAPALSLDKMADPATYDSVGDTISYSYVLTNTGNVTLSGPFTVNDDKATVTCPADASLAPGASITCSATYIIMQADLDAGFVTNTAHGHAFFNGDPVDSNEDSETVDATQSPALSLDKTATPTTYDSVGDTISYGYVLTNTGNVTLFGPFSVTDDKATVLCSVTVSLAPDASITCTATYSITQADLDAGSVTNTAQGKGSFNGNDVFSNEDSETVDAVQSPALSLVKMADPTTYDSTGDVISYSYVLTNTGNVTLSGPFTVTDDKAAVTCPATASLSPGASITCTATYTITQADLDAGLVTNTAQGHASFNGNPVDSNQDSETVTAVQSPSIDLKKTVTSTGPYDSVGDTITYELVATNTGNVTLSNVTISDPLLGTLVCTPVQPATLAPNATLTCTGSYAVTQADLDAGQVSNTATAKGTFNNTDYTDTDSQTVPMTQSPSLIVDKQLTDNADEDGSGTVSLNDTLTYTITATNNGNITLHNVTVSDSLTGDSTTCASVAPGDTCVLTVTYVVTQADVDEGNIHNVGTADSDETPPTEDTNDVPVPQNPALSLEKTGAFDAGANGYADPGELITYTFVVTNTGNVTLHNVSISDPNIPTITCPSANPIPLLPVGTSETCTGTYAVTQADIDAGSVYNLATADSKESGPDDDDNTEPLPQNPALSLEKTGTFDAGANGYADPGELITYTFVVTNTGNVTLHNVSVTDPKVSQITCSSTTIPVGQSVTCSGTYAVTQADIDAGSVYNLATADSDESGPDDDDNIEPLPQNPAISINKVTVDGSAASDGLHILAGETIGWKYIVKNEGNVTLNNIVVTDDQGVTVSCPKTTLTPNESMTCTASGTAATGSYSNTGTVSASDPQGDPASASDGSSYFGTDPQIAVAKVTVDGATSGDGLNILTGEPVKWRYTVTNVGNVALSNVTVTDSVSGVIPVYISGDANNNNQLDLTETWIFEASGTAATGNYSNTGTARGTFTDSAGHSRTDTASDSSSYFGANPQIDIVKKTVGSDGTEGDNVFILTGATVTWKYYVTNTGNVALSNVTVIDNQAGVTVTCPQTTLAVGASMTCTATGTNTTPIGSTYSNIGTANGSYTDSAGHSRTATDSDGSGYYSGNPGMVTNSSLCDFGTSFRLIFTPDVQYYTSSLQAYKLSDSNPGQFFYNVFQTGGTGTVTLTLPYPFVTQGATPIHVYRSLTVGQSDGQYCLQPTNEIRNYQTQVTLSSYPANNYAGTTTVTLTGLPTSGFMYINIHLDYGLEKLRGWVKNGSTATYNTSINPSIPRVNIVNNTRHTFTSSIPNSTDSIYNQNEFKRVKGFGGLVKIKTGTIDGVDQFAGLEGATVQLWRGNTLIETMTTDVNGWYLSDYLHKGSAATYTVKVIANTGHVGAVTFIYPTQSQSVSVGGSLKFGEGNFQIIP